MKKIFLLALLLIPYKYLYSQNEVDNSNKPQLIARIIVDGGLFLNQMDSLTGGVNFTDVRLGAKGKYDNWYYKLDVGFVNSDISLKDVFFGYRLENHEFQLGQFFEPFSMSYLTSSVDAKFSQPLGAASAFGSYRKLGISYTYNVDKFNFIFGTFSDNSANDLQVGSKAYSFHSRFIYRPIYNDNKLLHLGLTPSWKKTDSELVLSSRGNSKINISPITYVRLVDADSQVRLGTEVYLSVDNFSIQAEYMFTNVWGSGYSYFANGGYVEVTYIPYGGRYNYSSASGVLSRPKERSLELVVRYNYLNMDDYSENILGGEYQDFSVGANYYFNSHFAAKLNYSCLFPINNVLSIDNQPLSMIQLRVLFVL